MKKFLQDMCIFIFGGLVYGLLELMWRQYTHWTMILTGGLCFYLLYTFYNRYTHLPLFIKCIAGSAVITTVEFIVGCTVNIFLDMNVWSYSYLPFNLFGQISLMYSIIWGILSIPIYYISIYINKHIFNRKSGADNFGINF